MKYTLALVFSQSFLFLSVAFCGNVSPQSNLTTGLPPCDALIDAGLGDRLVLPSYDSYAQTIQTWWSKTSWLTPWCIVLPQSAEEVSETVKALVHAGRGAGDWHVAIRSGGHMSPAGVNNIDNGVTIDLSAMNRSTYNAQTKLASLQPGARWKHVYAELGKSNVMVVGGRDGGVGVGGIMIGGGISHYATNEGFACDTVANFEVVLADGRIINANRSANNDLWKALKGGGSNFGIVTRFDVNTFPVSNVSTTTRVMSSNQSNEYIDALVDFTASSNKYEEDAIIGFYEHLPGVSEIQINLQEINNKNRRNSTAFEKFDSIPVLKQSTSSQTPADMAEASQVAGGYYTTGATLTFKNDAQIMRYGVQLHEELVQTLSTKIGAENFTTFWFYEPIASNVAKIGHKNGGNMLGLPLNENVIIWDAGVGVFTDEVAFAIANEEFVRTTSRLAEFSKSLSKDVPLVYLNYADVSQDPLGSYPAENQKLIRELAAKYDPSGVFQDLVPGGFKISRVAPKP